MTTRGSKRQDSPSRVENLEKLLAKKAKVITNIDRIRQSVVDRTISFNPMELECRMDILKSYNDQAMKLQSDVGNLDSDNDNDPTIMDIEKFNHLISCLSESTLGTVKAFQISQENYPKALASLKKVYDNKCLIFFDNIAKLFDLPKLSSLQLLLCEA